MPDQLFESPDAPGLRVRVTRHFGDVYSSELYVDGQLATCGSRLPHEHDGFEDPFAARAHRALAEFHQRTRWDVPREWDSLWCQWAHVVEGRPWRLMRHVVSRFQRPAGMPEAEEAALRGD